jgi:hypothetical protein
LERGLAAGTFEGTRRGELAGVVGNDVLFQPTYLMPKGGLVLHYDASNNKCVIPGQTRAIDLSGMGNNGKFINNVTLQPIRKGILNFDAANLSSIDSGLASNLNFPTAFSIGVWVYPFAIQYAPDINIIGRLNESSGYSGYAMVYLPNSNTIQLYYNAAGRLGAPAIVREKWTFIVITWQSGGNASIYYNDVLVAQNQPPSEPVSLNFMPFRIGCYIFGVNNRHFNGQIPISFSYNRALSQSEVQSIYIQTKNRFL